jgi:hypothetical protein
MEAAGIAPASPNYRVVLTTATVKSPASCETDGVRSVFGYPTPGSQSSRSNLAESASIIFTTHRNTTKVTWMLFVSTIGLHASPLSNYRLQKL